MLMALRPGEEIGEEAHTDRDQFFRVEKGVGEIWIDGVKTRIRNGMALSVPAGARDNVKNTGNEPLKLYTVYAPPEHFDGIVRARKWDAEASEEHFDGKTTESQTPEQAGENCESGLKSIGLCTAYAIAFAVNRWH